MKVTPAQVLTVLDIAPETLRYWKRHLLPLKSKRGQGPTYTRAELVSLWVIKQLVRNLGIEVSSLASIGDELFRLCAVAYWAKPSQRVLVVGPSSITVVTNPTEIDLSHPAICISLDVAINELEGKFDLEERAPQLDLALPPGAIAKRGRGAQ